MPLQESDLFRHLDVKLFKLVYKNTDELFQYIFSVKSLNNRSK